MTVRLLYDTSVPLRIIDRNGDYLYVDQVRPGRCCQNAPRLCPRGKEKQDAGYSDRIQTHLISFGCSPPQVHTEENETLHKFLN
jgi:hypothetical protein